MSEQYRALRTVRVLLDGQIVDLVAGREYTIKSKEVGELVRAGFLTPLGPFTPGPGPETTAIGPSEQAVAPKAKPRKGAIDAR